MSEYGVRVSISVMLPEEKYKELAALSVKKGILKSSMVRGWIYEKLEEEQKSTGG